MTLYKYCVGYFRSIRRRKNWRSYERVPLLVLMRINLTKFTKKITLRIQIFVFSILSNVHCVKIVKLDFYELRSIIYLFKFWFFISLKHILSSAYAKPTAVKSLYALCPWLSPKSIGLARRYDGYWLILVPFKAEWLEISFTTVHFSLKLSRPKDVYSVTIPSKLWERQTIKIKPQHSFWSETLNI